MRAEGTGPIRVAGAVLRFARWAQDRCWARAWGDSPAAAVHTVCSDLAAPASLPTAIDGIERMHLFPSGEGGRGVGRAEQAGVRRIVALSSGAVTGGCATDCNLRFEPYLSSATERSKVDRTHDRPGDRAQISTQSYCQITNGYGVDGWARA